MDGVEPYYPLAQILEEAGHFLNEWKIRICFERTKP